MWINANIFCDNNSIGLRNLQKKSKKAIESNEKILHIDTKIFSYRYTQGKGRGGKTLQIWSKPLSKEEAKLVEQGFNIEDISNTTISSKTTQEVLSKPLNDDALLKNSNALQVQSTNEIKLRENQIQINKDSLSEFAKASSKKQNLALQKAAVVKEWLHAKGKISANDFISYINAKKIYEFKLTQNKLFAWQKEYLAHGLDALVDKRENKKADEIERLGIKELFVNTLLAQKGRLNASNIHRIINYEIAKNGKLDLKDFLGKKDEFISYECVLRSMKKYLKENKLIKNIILHGEDGAISRHLPALGVSNWKVSTINEIVEIDASPLDAICKVDFINEKYGLKGEECSWHKRYTIISLIDTYSGVASFYLGFSEDSLSIARAIAKYISTYGLPKCIHSDNGKAFLSKNVKALLERLNIDYKAMPAYSGWAKPYVENKFKDLQNSLTANLVGYIGANVKERQAIEFFYSKKERRLKKGYKTNQRRLKTLEFMRACIDDYSAYFMNSKWLDRLGATPKESYETKIEDAIAMDELSLSMYLGGELKLRKILNKGLSLNGTLFYNPKLYIHEEVYVCENLNNQNEIFCFDKQKELICVANNLDLELGVSVEEAKEARKLVNKAIKASKDKIDKQRVILEKNMEKYLELGTQKLEKVKAPKVKISNNAKEELEFSNTLVSNGDVERFAKKSEVKLERKIPKWENAAKKAGY
ncbi:Mu transposase C-terminal domain-containing protein [Campylobacter jejuni]|uniref:Mu transposase C-terminal domain-containing protein n=1 Tax=Campylobacter jejuni TaxID=197 RepID=UPI001378D8A0|nr:Mu transposase C-terminal domain-containing protein [Campylobacter jejuni]EHR9968348.1 DDE-type integrase/transposase/recombinase [Campylobacter jejuni]NBE34254.1 DDE-type integrase/transposase/recombinase [Campylobacter jejuni]NBE86434.1 DDE-type integrase/transposase/recombinase [Campylobacter jejuni]